MSIIITLSAILMLVWLISYARLNTFLAFLIVSLFAGLLLGLTPGSLLTSIEKGIGSMLGSLVGIIALGSMLGKLVGSSGAAQHISEKIASWIGLAHIRWAFMITGFIVGLPLFYSVGFMLLVPIAITIAYRNNLSAVFVSLPLLASLSVTQGFLPPHPAPLFLVKQLQADLGLTLWYGILVSIPAILISGALFGSTIKKYTTLPNLSFVSPQLPSKELPPAHLCFMAVLLPVLLIAAGAFLAPFLANETVLKELLLFVSDPTISLLISVIFALLFLGFFKKKKMQDVNKLLIDAVKDVSPILLIFGAAGALKQVLTDAGVSAYLAQQLQHLHMNPYILGWCIAAILRVIIGSSTVAGITTAGFITPYMQHPSINANLMVLSIGAGSMMFSHVNDTGFWLFREYFQLSMKDTIKTWSVMDTLVSVTGLLGILLLSFFL